MWIDTNTSALDRPGRSTSAAVTRTSNSCATIQFATKRVLRAILRRPISAPCDPGKLSRGGWSMGVLHVNLDTRCETLNEVLYNKWREYDTEDSIRVYSLAAARSRYDQSPPQQDPCRTARTAVFLNQLSASLRLIGAATVASGAAGGFCACRRG